MLTLPPSTAALPSFAVLSHNSRSLFRSSVREPPSREWTLQTIAGRLNGVRVRHSWIKALQSLAPNSPPTLATQWTSRPGLAYTYQQIVEVWTGDLSLSFLASRHIEASPLPSSWAQVPPMLANSFLLLMENNFQMGS